MADPIVDNTAFRQVVDVVVHLERVVDVVVQQEVNFLQQEDVYVLLERPVTVTVDLADLGAQESDMAQGWIKITDVEPTDTATYVSANKVWQDAGESILQSLDVTDYDVDITIKSSYPLVTVNGQDFELTEAADAGHYSGTVSTALDDAAASNIYDVVASNKTADNLSGASDTVRITVESAPEILTLSFTGGYPGSQTELKAGDTFQITGTTDKSTDAIDIQDFGAFAPSLEVIVAGTTFTVSGTVADRGDVATQYPARVRARSALTGGFGPTFDSDDGGGSTDGVHVVTLNNLHPSVSFGSVSYPGVQQALKSTEQATIPMTTSGYDTLNYSSPTGELTVVSGDGSSVTVQRFSGTYNVSTPNIQASANRAANDADTVTSSVVKVANIAPTITVATPAARLQSGGSNGTSAQNHTITLTSDQQLLSAPSLAPDSGGNRGSLGSFSGSLATWTATLAVDETVPDEKGTFNWESLVATGLSGIVQTSIDTGDSYVLGGFVARSLTFAAFSAITTIGTEVSDFSKLSAGIFTATNQAALKQVIGTSAPVTNGYTIDAIDTNPTSLTWLDTAAVASNSGGTAQITNVQESV